LGPLVTEETDHALVAFPRRKGFFAIRGTPASAGSDRAGELWLNLGVGSGATLGRRLPPFKNLLEHPS
jgi:hypothetical protein